VSERTADGFVDSNGIVWKISLVMAHTWGQGNKIHQQHHTQQPAGRLVSMVMRKLVDARGSQS
jgi:hypothetical protein